MTKALAQTYTTIHTYRVNIMRMLCVGCALAIAWYGLNVYSAISRTIIAEHIGANSSALSNSVNTLGSKYIQLANLASPNALTAHDMKVSPVTVYIPRTASLGSASLGSVALSGHSF